MATFPGAYKHGAYGSINESAVRSTELTENAIVYVGFAPVHLVVGGTDNVNKPVRVDNMAQAKKLFGYMNDRKDVVVEQPLFTLCEAMDVHFAQNGVGPLVFINCFDPSTLKASTKTTLTKTAANGKTELLDDLCIVDTIEVKKSSAVVDKSKYRVTVTDNGTTAKIALEEIEAGAFGSAELTIEYYQIDLTDFADDAPDMIAGESDGIATHSGVYAIRDVYHTTGMVPSMLVVPFYSSNTTVHTAMKEAAKKINGHWDCWMMTDLPQSAATLGTDPITLVADAKSAGGFNSANESVFWPAALGTDGHIYNLSTLAAGNFHVLMVELENIPYRTVSNTACPIILKLYDRANAGVGYYDEELVNKYLNSHGINSAAFVAGRWALWGGRAADYDYSGDNAVAICDANRMMLYYISNDFQQRRALDVDKPMTKNDLMSIVSEEQARLDALIKIGALIYGVVETNVTEDDMSDIVNGDFAFSFNVTTTPVAKSLTAVVNWTDEGFVTYFENFGEQ